MYSKATVSPLETLSPQYVTTLQDCYLPDVGNIKSVYYQNEGIVITFMPVDNKAYVYDFTVGKRALPRITTWSFKDNPLCAVSTLSGELYMGLSDSVAEYEKYYDVALDSGGNDVDSDYNWLSNSLVGLW